MSESDPVQPRGASAAGYALAAIGWGFVALAVGLVIVQVVLGTLSIGGLFLALMVIAVAGAAFAMGHGIKQSRER